MWSISVKSKHEDTRPLQHQYLSVCEPVKSKHTHKHKYTLTWVAQWAKAVISAEKKIRVIARPACTN